MGSNQLTRFILFATGFRVPMDSSSQIDPCRFMSGSVVVDGVADM